ncbi:MAG: CubicO group peptidase beta-lactamase class family [Sphingobacteriales bacterium]|nr:CubicO group peptidase beta-lactamase class family [Sphingobacteriales bacterium]
MMPSRFFILLSFLSLASCKVFRPLVYNVPDQKDGKRFPYRVVHSSDSDAVFHFKTTTDTLPEIRNLKIDNRSVNSTGVNLDEFVKLHRTLSFLIIRNDSILYQYYAKDLSPETRVSSFSISKAYVAMLIGIAIHDGLIKGIDQPIIDFIPEWKDRKGYQLITIKNLLRHTSGLKFTTSMVNLLSDQSQFYYMDGLRKRILNAQIAESPGLHFNYQSENTSLLGLILERVTGKSLSACLEEKIWKPIGTEAPAYWSTDSDDSTAIEKSFCCLNARTVDFAKFARLLLKSGNWQGEQIVPAHWIKEATTGTSEDGGKTTYGYGMGLGPKAYGSFFPVGLYGQFLYVYPKQNIILVRFGNSTVPYIPDYWKEVMLQIIDQL